MVFEHLSDLVSEKSLSLILNRWSSNHQLIRLLGNWENHVYEVQLDHQIYILRVTDISRRTATQIADELHWVNQLVERGLNVNRPIRSKEGRWVESIQFGDTTLLACLFQKMQGVSITPASILNQPDRFLPLLGTTMAQIHNASENTIRNNRITRFSWDDDPLIQNALIILQKHNKNRIKRWDQIMEWLGSLNTAQQHFGIVHADLHGRNFFVHQETIHFFDCDDCCWHWYIYDIAVLFNWIFPYPHPQRAATLQQFLQTYTEIRPLGSLWIKRIYGFMELRTYLDYLFAIEKMESGYPVKERKEKLEMKLDYQELLL